MPDLRLLEWAMANLSKLELTGRQEQALRIYMAPDSMAHAGRMMDISRERVRQHLENICGKVRKILDSGGSDG